ncbi:DarT ssDNA thymidine ADP-ribosyltransferase family protein [Micromonospora lupini]|uniref:DarT ssDNA thymidine ADP-ribosyltransferase family protein n=1 Tax=Micromonospora lupini TaxID=285679 RepID=UPI0033CDC8C1
MAPFPSGCQQSEENSHVNCQLGDIRTPAREVAATADDSAVPSCGLVDWPLLGARIWKDVPDDMDRMRRRAAEFLVHRKFPVDLLTGYVARTTDRQEQVR